MYSIKEPDDVAALRAENEKLRTQLADATARAERAEGERDHAKRCAFDHETSLVAAWQERDEARAQLAEAQRELDALRSRTESMACDECGEPAVVEISISAGAHCSGWIPKCERCHYNAESTTQEIYDHEMRCFGGAYGAPMMSTRTLLPADARKELDELIKRAEQAEARATETERRLVVADTIAANRLEALERAESLCTERGEQVSRLFGQLRDMQTRAEQAESRVLSDEMVRRIRGWTATLASYEVDDDWTDRDQEALAELDAKYPAKVES